MKLRVVLVAGPVWILDPIELDVRYPDLLSEVRGDAQRVAHEGFWVDKSFYPPSQIRRIDIIDN